MTDDAIAECECQKVRFMSRRSAKTAAGKLRAQMGRMSAYRCPTSLGEVWHIGHLPPRVRNGQVSLDDWRRTAVR